MRRLALYESPPRIAVDDAEATMPTADCKRCSLHEKAKNVCMRADGEPGGLLVIGEAPTREEDMRGRPFIGQAGVAVRKIVEEHWKGPVVYDYALRCPIGRELTANQKKKALESCRSYLAQVVADASPTRIITLGGAAAYALLGRNPQPHANRRGYQYWRSGERNVPAFFVMDAWQMHRNSIHRKWITEDLIWAFKANPPLPPWDGVVHLVETLDDSLAAVADAKGAAWTTFDTETAGLMFSPSFRIVCASLVLEGERDAYVWTREACADPKVRKPLEEYLRDARYKKGGTNGKYDQSASYAAFGVMPRNLNHDVRLWRKLLEPEAPAGLSTMGELVGMGGMKEENEELQSRVVDEVQKLLSAERRYEKAKVKAQERLAEGTMRKVKAKPAPDVSFRLRTEFGIDEELEKIIRDDNHEKEKWVYAATVVKDPDTVYRYNARDSVGAAELVAHLKPQLDAQPNLRMVWDEIVRDASDAVAQVESWGVACDVQAIDLVHQHLCLMEDEAQKALDGYMPGINWGSTDQLVDVLFKRWCLPVIKLTESGNESTDKDVLEKLAKKHPAIPHLLKLRKAQKLKSYSKGKDHRSGMLAHVRHDGRIHPSILLDGARSGRTSCQDPNLQNIPRAGTAEGKMIRDLFVASPGHWLFEYDYSQLELRVAAMLSGDPEMIKVFNTPGVDFHLRVAQMIAKTAWGIEADQVTEEQRSLTKPVVFGKMYGKGIKQLAEDMKCSVEQAQRIIDLIFGKFHVFDRWCKEQVIKARRTGYTCTYWNGKVGRMRPLPMIADVDEKKRSVAEHGSYNTPIQGTASEYCVRSLVEVVKWIREDVVPAKLVLAVHDSILLEVREDAAAEVEANVPRIMESWYSGPVPLIADGKRGRSWGSLEKMKRAA